MAFGVRKAGLALFFCLLWLARPALAATAPATAPAAPRAEPHSRSQAAPHPAIWLLADADTRIYLFGTVHILHPDLRWRSAALDRVAGEAQELVLELDEEEMARSGPELMAPMQLGKSVPILSRVSADRREALGRLLRQLEIPEGSLDGLETWAVALILGVTEMAREYAPGAGGAGTAPPPGVEEALTADFRGRGRPVSGVETALDQIGAFRGMPPAVQRAMLEDLIDDYRNGEPAGEPDEAAWVSGDLDGIAAEMEEMPPELFEALVTRRNRRFADWLAARLERPGTILFAVGAGHLAGRVSVQSMLESRGFTVTRIN